MSAPLCPFCEEPLDEDYGCDGCGSPCCSDCSEYRETHPATRLDPADGVSLCPDCVGSEEASAELAAERAAEHREDLRW